MDLEEWNPTAGWRHCVSETLGPKPKTTKGTLPEHKQLFDQKCKRKYRGFPSPKCIFKMSKTFVKSVGKCVGSCAKTKKTQWPKVTLGTPIFQTGGSPPSHILKLMSWNAEEWGHDFAVAVMMFAQGWCGHGCLTMQTHTADENEDCTTNKSPTIKGMRAFQKPTILVKTRMSTFTWDFGPWNIL